MAVVHARRIMPKAQGYVCMRSSLIGSHASSPFNPPAHAGSPRKADVDARNVLTELQLLPFVDSGWATKPLFTSLSMQGNCCFIATAACTPSVVVKSMREGVMCAVTRP